MARLLQNRSFTQFAVVKEADKTNSRLKLTTDQFRGIIAPRLGREEGVGGGGGRHKAKRNLLFIPHPHGDLFYSSSL